MNRDFKGVWISKEIWLDTRLNALDKIILTEIDSLDNENHCIASNDYLSEFCQCSISSISRSIKKLVELNYIEILSFDGRSRVIQSRVSKMKNQPSQNDEAANPKCTPINIDNNINNNIYNHNDIYSYIENNFGRTLSPIEYEEIKSWRDNELTRYAIKQAVLNNKYSIKYISKILFNYSKNNIQTVQQAQEQNLQFQEKKNPVKNNNINPDWFNQESDVVAPDDKELEEMNKLIEELSS